LIDALLKFVTQGKGRTALLGSSTELAEVKPEAAPVYLVAFGLRVATLSSSAFIKKANKSAARSSVRRLSRGAAFFHPSFCSATWG
jgi:hypothetical protein